MIGWLKIGDTGVSVLRILELLGRGYSRRAILRRLPSLTEKDIADAVLRAHDFILHSLVTSCLSQQPSVYGQPEHATETGEQNLTDSVRHEIHRLYRYGASPLAIARLFRIAPHQADSLFEESERDG